MVESSIPIALQQVLFVSGRLWLNGFFKRTGLDIGWYYKNNIQIKFTLEVDKITVLILNNMQYIFYDYARWYYVRMGTT